MDNVTHALAGMLVAEVVCSLRREARPELRRAAYLLSALANNLPDIDGVYASWLTGPKPIGYLVHHRGHTHTLLFAAVAAPLLYWLALRLYRRRNIAFSAAESRVLLGLTLAGPLLHLLMDFGNNYGVHPFWPISGRWFYGDTIFIIEPLWLVLAIPVLVQTVARRWLKALLWLPLAVVLVVCWFVPFVLPAVRYTLIALAVIAFVVGAVTEPRARAGFVLVAWLAVSLLFATGSRRAKAALTRAAESAFPALEIHDLVVTPLPAHPWCYEGLLVGEQGGLYRVVTTSIALPPISLAACPAGMGGEGSARMQLIDRPDREGVRFRREYQAELAKLRALRASDCRFAAMLQFVRVPYLTDHSGSHRHRAEGLYAGDLRYDREPGLDFADIVLPRDPRAGNCPRFLPGWVEPRADLLAR